jgi:hypothetical protein
MALVCTALVCPISKGVCHSDDHVAAVRLADGTVVPRQALAVAARMTALAGFLADLGLKARIRRGIS